MASIQTQFMNIEKKIRQLSVVKMQDKMDNAAKKTMSYADKTRVYDNVTGNLYKSTAIGTYHNGSLQSIHVAPGPNPTRLTLEKGETYNLDSYYRSPFTIKNSGRKPYKGEFGKGGENGPETAEDILLYNEHGRNRYSSAWQMLLVAGVEYADFVSKKKKHNILSELRDYMVRYFRKL